MAIDANLVHRGRGRLYQGSRPPEGVELAAAGVTTLVLAAIEHQPPSSAFPGVRVIHCPLRDTRTPTAHELAYALECAELVHARVSAGERVLVTCRAGLNRSGLINGFALVRGGMEPARAVQAIRMGRERNALCNATFVRAILASHRIAPRRFA